MEHTLPPCNSPSAHHSRGHHSRGCTRPAGARAVRIILGLRDEQANGVGRGARLSIAIDVGNEVIQAVRPLFTRTARGCSRHPSATVEGVYLAERLGITAMATGPGGSHCSAGRSKSRSVQVAPSKLVGRDRTLQIRNGCTSGGFQIEHRDRASRIVGAVAVGARASIAGRHDRTGPSDNPLSRLRVDE